MEHHGTSSIRKRNNPTGILPKRWCCYVCVALCATSISIGQAESNGEKTNGEHRPISVNGVFPSLTVLAKGTGSDSEAGIGALIPWAEKLWAVGYVAHIRGDGLGLYEISEDMTMRRHPASVLPRISTKNPWTNC